MHEAGLVERLIKSVKEEIKERKDFLRVKKIYLRLGKTMAITEESLRFWFESLSQGTELEGADLEVTLYEGNTLAVEALEVE